MGNRNRLDDGLDIEKLFVETYEDLGLDEADRKQVFRAFMAWYQADLRERWKRKLTWWLSGGWKEKR